ncbi:MAG: OprO/OprP family phosphate-selective porin [Thermoleophilia bacterium]|nr:OprO/OprP family phosphate-selective porin [Thermoleophilia bacterium]
MRKLLATISLIPLTFAVVFSAAAQGVPSLDQLWAIIQEQQAEIDALKEQVAAAESNIAGASERIEQTEQMVVATGDYIEDLEIPEAQASRTTVGGYGELHYNHLDAEDPSRDLEEIDFHRFVLFFGHEFSERVSFHSELELEHSLAGEGDDKPGEMEIEQAYINFALNSNLAAQGGLVLLPVGILNETHEPPTFYGVERNDVENIIIPTTWWEAGGGVSGNLANGLSWNAMVHSGLAMPTIGDSAFRVRSGRQKVAEALASDPAYTFRLKYTGTPGLELSASYQYQSDPSQTPGDGLDSGSLFTAHAIYGHGAFSLRALYGAWSFDGLAVEAAGADDQSGWFVEPSYRLNEQWGVYARYEDIEGAREQDVFSEWQAGLSYWPVPDVVLKLDYRSRDHELPSQAGRDFDGFDLGIGYQF